MAERDRNGGPSYPFPVWNGIFDHRRKIAAAIWVFMWCIDRVTREDGGIGFVLGGSVVTVDKIAAEVDESPRSVRRNLRHLSDHGYINLKLSAHGFIISVTKSCKFGVWRSAKNGRPEISTGRPNLVCPEQKMSDHADKNGRPHKEKVFDSAVDPVVTQQKPCTRCEGTGVRPHPGHPGQLVVCEH